MAGHSKWAQIKHKKATADAKRSKLFSKVVKMITMAAREGGDPNFNPKLKSALEKAKEANLPKESIDKAIRRGSGEGSKSGLEEVIYEAYGPAGSALVITGITDNKNRTTQEIKRILNENGAKMSGPGSVMFLFEKKNGDFEPKVKISVAGDSEKEQLKKLFIALDEHEDVQEIYSNIAEDIGN